MPFPGAFTLLSVGKSDVWSLLVNRAAGGKVPDAAIYLQADRPNKKAAQGRGLSETR